MTEVLLWVVLAITFLIAVMSIVLLFQRTPEGATERSARKASALVRDELRLGREEARGSAKELREEISASLKDTHQTLTASLDEKTRIQQERLQSMATSISELTSSNQVAQDRTRDTIDLRIKELQQGNEKKLEEVKLEVSAGLRTAGEAVSRELGAFGNVQQERFAGMQTQLKELGDSNEKALDGIRGTLDSRVKELQQGNEKKLDEMKGEVSSGLRTASESVTKSLDTVAKTQQERLDGMTGQIKELGTSTQKTLEGIRDTVDKRVRELQEGNEKRLEEMRKTVDEKLHDTLEKRLGESFNLVSQRLEAVQKGLGEMRALAAGVGDLQRVLTNVKSRGTWAEIQLGSILEQFLTAEQFAKNVAVKSGSSERVEYAVRLPGRDGDPSSCVWLPIDSKFPQEDYIRLQDAADKADADAVHTAAVAIAKSIKNSAKDVNEKYINPPKTTDFAIIFLATEGLYAEVIRQPELVDQLQRDHRVIVAGPTTLAALLSSLRMGFQTLAIEKRSSEVWEVLGAVKTEFSKFGKIIGKVRGHLTKASDSLEETDRRTRAMERKLRSVERLPDPRATAVLADVLIDTEEERD